MSNLDVGSVAPDFTLQNQAGEPVTLSEYKGKVIVLYFYPKDDTPGCTKEACAFRDGRELLQNQGAVVLGVSRDTVKSHDKFVQKYNLNFPLLADVTGEVCETYGVLKEKTMYGRTSIGIERTTFVIDRDFKFARVFPKVKVDEHITEVLDTIASL